jgi:hypothetical protein
MPSTMTCMSYGSVKYRGSTIGLSRKSRERSRTVPRERACVTFGVRQNPFSVVG